MQSVWASLSSSVRSDSDARSQRTNNNQQIPPHVRAQQPAVASIWSQPLRSVESSSNPFVELYHPRYEAGSDSHVAKKLVQQNRVKPLLVPPSYGSAGLEEHPQYDSILWPDTSRARLPLRSPHPDEEAFFPPPHINPAPAIMRMHNATLSQERISYTGSLISDAAAIHPPPPATAAAVLSGLQLTNIGTHIPHPDQLMPFTSLVAGLTPAPLSDAGFKPLNIASIENRWNRVLGLPSAVSDTQKAQLQRDSTTEQEVQTDQLRDVQPTILQHELALPLSSLQMPSNHHRDIATSPMGKEYSAQAHQTYSLAFSPQHSPRATKMTPSQPSHSTHSRYEFPPAPAGVNPDAYLTHQAEHLHQFSIRALKQQIDELKKEGRAIEKDQRASDKDTLYREHKWNELVGLSTVQESISEGLDLSSSNYLEEADAALRHALTLEDEKVVSTQTDASLSLQHALKPRMAGRKGTLRHALDLQERQTMQQAIEKQVAAEYAQKEAEAFGVKPPSTDRPRGTALLPKFQSQADQYREQLREQYRVLFEAKLASQASQGSVAGQLVEARLKKLRDDTLFAANPYRLAATVKQKEQEQEMKDPSYRMPDTIIGSRTAALLFVDPVMMYRKTNPQQITEQQTRAPIDPSTQVPNKVEELTKRNAEELKAHLGFEIPAPTFVGSGTTHRQLKFASVYSDSGEIIPVAKTAAAPAPPPINVAQVAPSSVLEEPPINAESNLDHLNIFGGKKPLQVLKHEFSDLDEDVHKLEQTIRMLHAEFSAPPENTKPTQATQQPPPGTHALVPTYQEVQAKQLATISTSAKSALLQGQSAHQHDSSVDPRQMQSAQRILHSVDNVLGVTGSALTRSPPRPVSSNRPMSLIQQYQQLQQQQNDLTRAQPSASKPGTSKLVQALEKYLSLDISFDALSQSSKSAAHSASVKESLHSFPTAPHDLNRPPEFTSQHLSPSLLREREEKEREEKRMQREIEEKHQQEEEARRKHDRERRHSHSGSSSSSHHHRSSHSHSHSHSHSESRSHSHHPSEPRSPSHRRHSEVVSPKHSSKSSSSSRNENREHDLTSAASSSRHARALTPSSSMRLSHSTLARVVEGDQETSHSSVGTSGEIHGLSLATGDDEEDEGPDSALDRSRIITLDSHAQPLYDDSTDSIHHAALISPSYSQQPPARPLTQVQINRRPMSPPYPPGGPPRSQSVQHPPPPPPSAAVGPRSPNSARRRVSVPIAATQVVGSPAVSSLQTPEVAPRTNRAAELRKQQLEQQAAHANLIAARAAGRPASSASRKPMSPTPTSAAAAAAAAAADSAAARKSGIELERERLRMKKQRANAGMMQLTHSRDFQHPQQANRSQYPQPPSVSSSVNQSLNSSSPLETSTDRQIADVNNMMANFRQLLDDLPAPAPKPVAQNPKQHYHEETPQSTYRDPFESDEVWPTPTPLNDSDFHNDQPMSTSWEDEFRHDDVLRDEEPTPATTGTQHNPLDDFD